MKYRPDFPKRFDNIEQARAFCRDFFAWYNLEHSHVGLGLQTPSDVHHGRALEIHEARATDLNNAYAAHPERFVRKVPTPPALPTAGWINKPEEKEESAQ